MSTVDQNPPIQPSIVTTTASVHPQRPVGQSGRVPKQLMSTVSRNVANNIGKKNLSDFDGQGQLFSGQWSPPKKNYDFGSSSFTGNLSDLANGEFIFDKKTTQQNPPDQKHQLFFLDNEGNWYKVNGSQLTPISDPSDNYKLAPFSGKSDYTLFLNLRDKFLEATLKDGVSPGDLNSLKEMINQHYSDQYESLSEGGIRKILRDAFIQWSNSPAMKAKKFKVYQEKANQWLAQYNPTTPNTFESGDFNAIFIDTVRNQNHNLRNASDSAIVNFLKELNSVNSSQYNPEQYQQYLAQTLINWNTYHGFKPSSLDEAITNFRLIQNDLFPDLEQPSFKSEKELAAEYVDNNPNQVYPRESTGAGAGESDPGGTREKNRAEKIKHVLDLKWVKSDYFQQFVDWGEKNAEALQRHKTVTLLSKAGLRFGEIYGESPSTFKPSNSNPFGGLSTSITSYLPEYERYTYIDSTTGNRISSGTNFTATKELHVPAIHIFKSNNGDYYALVGGRAEHGVDVEPKVVKLDSERGEKLHQGIYSFRHYNKGAPIDPNIKYLFDAVGYKPVQQFSNGYIGTNPLDAVNPIKDNSSVFNLTASVVGLHQVAHIKDFKEQNENQSGLDQLGQFLIPFYDDIVGSLYDPTYEFDPAKSAFDIADVVITAISLGLPLAKLGTAGFKALKAATGAARGLKGATRAQTFLAEFTQAFIKFGGKQAAQQGLDEIKSFFLGAITDVADLAKGFGTSALYKVEKTLDELGIGRHNGQIGHPLSPTTPAKVDEIGTRPKPSLDETNQLIVKIDGNNRIIKKAPDGNFYLAKNAKDTSYQTQVRQNESGEWEVVKPFDFDSVANRVKPRNPVLTTVLDQVPIPGAKRTVSKTTVEPLPETPTGMINYLKDIVTTPFEHLFYKFRLDSLKKGNFDSNINKYIDSDGKVHKGTDPAAQLFLSKINKKLYGDGDKLNHKYIDSFSPGDSIVTTKKKQYYSNLLPGFQVPVPGGKLFIKAGPRFDINATEAFTISRNDDGTFNVKLTLSNETKVKVPLNVGVGFGHAGVIGAVIYSHTKKGESLDFIQSGITAEKAYEFFDKFNNNTLTLDELILSQLKTTTGSSAVSGGVGYAVSAGTPPIDTWHLEGTPYLEGNGVNLDVTPLAAAEHPVLFVSRSKTKETKTTFEVDPETGKPVEKDVSTSTSKKVVVTSEFTVQGYHTFDLGELGDSGTSFRAKGDTETSGSHGNGFPSATYPLDSNKGRDPATFKDEKAVSYQPSAASRGGIPGVHKRVTGEHQGLPTTNNPLEQLFGKEHAKEILDKTKQKVAERTNGEFDKEFITLEVKYKIHDEAIDRLVKKHTYGQVDGEKRVNHEALYNELRDIRKNPKKHLDKIEVDITAKDTRPVADGERFTGPFIGKQEDTASVTFTRNFEVFKGHRFAEPEDLGGFDSSFTPPTLPSENIPNAVKGVDFETTPEGVRIWRPKANTPEPTQGIPKAVEGVDFVRTPEGGIIYLDDGETAV